MLRLKGFTGLVAGDRAFPVHRKYWEQRAKTESWAGGESFALKRKQ